MIRLHEDADLFRAAIDNTSEKTAFQARLVEKDYFASVALEYLAEANPELIFKGGTCLSKVHMDFFRLSEDLDFTIPKKLDSKRSERSKAAASAKIHFESLPAALPCFRVAEPLRGANSSSQYIGLLSYRSVVTREAEAIKVEISLREPLLTPAVAGQAKTILMDPVGGAQIVPVFTVPCISLVEAFAEKFRAAMTRREVAVRDFFDLDYAGRKKIIDPKNPKLLEILVQKLSVPGNDPVNLTDEQLQELIPQVEAHLAAVLREADLKQFDVVRAFRMVKETATQIGGRLPSGG